MGSKEENDWVLSSLRLPSEALRVLVVGCVWSSGRTYAYLSPFGNEVARRGYTVLGVDIRHSEKRTPEIIETQNLTSTLMLPYVLGDITKAPFKDGVFDQVVAISTIEHIGLLGYGNPVEDLDADGRAVDEMVKLLKAGGLMLITVPTADQFIIHRLNSYGKPSTNPGRGYDTEMLEQVFLSRLRSFEVSTVKIPPRAVGIKAEKHSNPCLEIIARNKDKIMRNILDFLKFKGLAYKEIFVYKSRVAGTCREDSDIDIYIQLEEKHRELVEKEGNIWGGKKGLDPRLILNWRKEMKDMGLVVIEKVYGEQYREKYPDGKPIELDMRMGLDPEPPYNPKYDGKRYSMKLSEAVSSRPKRGLSSTLEGDTAPSPSSSGASDISA